MHPHEQQPPALLPTPCLKQIQNDKNMNQLSWEIKLMTNHTTLLTLVCISRTLIFF